MLTSESIGGDTVDVTELLYLAGERLEWHQRNVILSDSRAVVLDRDLGQAVVLQPDFDAARPCVDGVLDKLPVKRGC